MLLDQNIGAEQDDWPLPEGAVRLAGLDYALMRDEIRARRGPPTHDPTSSRPCGCSRSSAAPTPSGPRPY